MLAHTQRLNFIRAEERLRLQELLPPRQGKPCTAVVQVRALAARASSHELGSSCTGASSSPPRGRSSS